MPASYQIDTRRSLVCVEHFGPRNQQQFFALIDRLLADPRLRPGMHYLSDHSRETMIQTPDGVIATLPRFAEFIHYLQASRVAVITSTRAQLGMAHFAAVYARDRGIELRPFQDRGEAEVWLCGEASPRRREKREATPRFWVRPLP